MYVGVNNTSKNLKVSYVGVENKSRKVVAIYVGVNGKAKETFRAGLVAPSNITLEGNFLKWNSVPKAETYDVFINNINSGTMSETSYDASELSNGAEIYIVAKSEKYGNSLPSEKFFFNK